jgi:hypothetical protein
MRAKRLVILVVPVFFLLSSAFAQVNELSATVGLTFVSTQTVRAAVCRFISETRRVRSWPIIPAAS